MRIEKMSTLTGNVSSMEIDHRNLRGWLNGDFNTTKVQDVFPDLDAGTREFLITGITPEEWDSMFKDSEAPDLIADSWLPETEVEPPF